MTVVLEVQNLSVAYAMPGGALQAVRDVSLSVARGEVLGIMGESGCGKSTLAAAMINLLPPAARVGQGAVRLNGTDMLRLAPAAQRALRGRSVAMVFQDPMTAFNPVLTIGQQVADFVGAHDASLARPDRLAAMLDRVGIPDAARCLGRYPHELSGGMRQRVAIAAALLMQPDVLIADEPTTALDVTMEAQIIHLLRDLRTTFDGAIVIVTHHLGVIAELCDRVAVMYAGEVVEEGPVDAIFHDPQHPYTRALLACDPAVVDPASGRLPTIAGRLPDLTAPPPGCAFEPRCGMALAVCSQPVPRRVPAAGRSVLCHRGAE
ncbi:MAG: ABC transporter ATP-binding protein [Tabrizicola sp.]|uniref:ABC transporter ATP-binding protein n=1 Tax=Tabrizicola sp. TaxID=2005166 RepID=UPI0027365CF9|nr:ABC transporter ATP-binding protein [Tabrizicola sp.]MDP3264608.1 ABC transporter ATP-binding protein [Tabrizicola sp.]MDP3647712.1 ABC transporter ATP-binding protein [Paracoccaceae bacterium]MDZ4067385.1 ABC transporter ATP-binding protein [Tabrizicola sp.]